MALPGVTVSVLDGNLNLQPGNNSRLMLYLGCCTGGVPNTLYTYGDITTMQGTLDAGQLVEAGAYGMTNAGGPAMFMPLNPSQRGGVSSVTKVGSGAGTIALTMAPHRSISYTCTTGGTLGTAVFTFTLGATATLAASTSAPVTSAAGWSGAGYQLPGTYVNIVFVAGTYVAGGTPDIYTISTLGAIAHPQGAGPAVPTFTASPVDNYNAKVTIGTGGALGTATFIYSLDNGESNLNGAGVNSATVVTPGGGAYAIPYTGIVMTFASTFVAADYYTFKTATATASSADVTSAITALTSTYLNQAIYSLVTLIGQYANIAAWATNAAALESFATTLFNNGVYVRCINEMPTVGTITASAAAVVVDVAETDSVVIASRATVSAPHVNGCAGDELLFSPITGLTLRRSAAWPVAMRSSLFEASRNVGDVSAGGVPGVIYLFRDENATQGMDAAGITTLRSFPGSGGVAGFYITDAHTCSLSTSDYYPWTNARVIDRGCGIARLNSLPLVNTKIPTTTRNGLVGVITEKKAQQVEGKLNSALRTGMVDTSPQDAVAASTSVNRTHNILSDGNLILSVAIQPFAYSRIVTVNIGMSVNA